MANCIICAGNDQDTLFEKNGYDLVRCKSDGHIFVSNPPSLDELSLLYSSEYFEGVANVGYHHDVLGNVEKQTKKAKRKLSRLKRLLPEGRVLDVGCGPGFFLNEASLSYRVVGCDWSQTTADYARAQFGLEINVEDFLKFQDSSPYDAITMFSYLEHTLDPRENLVKANDLLKEGGVLILALPNISGIVRHIMGQGWRGFELPEHLHFFNEKNLKRLLRETGFLPIKSRYNESNFFRDTNYFYARKK